MPTSLFQIELNPQSKLAYILFRTLTQLEILNLHFICFMWMGPKEPDFLFVTISSIAQHIEQ